MKNYSTPKDNGETWDSTIIQQPFSNNLQRQDGIFKSYDLGYDYYIYGLFLYSSNINVYGEFIKNDLDIFPQNSFNYHFTTDFYNNIRTSYDGEKLFILSKNHYYNSISEFSDSLHLIVKPQYGKADTFFVPYLNNYPPFFGSYTDHLGNYYLYNQNVLIMTRDEGKTWIDISPTDNRDVLINDLFVSADNYIYIATTGFGIMKYKSQLKEPATLYVNLYEDLNQNCALDSSDILLKYPIDLVINNNQKISVTNGQTSILLIDSTYKINLESNIGAYTFCDSTFEIFADAKQNLQYLDIPIRIKKLCNEPTIELINSSYPYCDQTLYKMRICNSGITSIVDEKLDILLPVGDNLISSSLNIISKEKNKASLNIGTIKPQECLTFNIYFNTGCENNIPESKCITLSLQDSLSNCTYPQENTSIAVFCLEEIGNPNRLYQINFYEDINENCTLDIEDILIPNDELIQNFKITFNTYLTNIPGNSFDLFTKENHNNLNLKYNIFDYKVCQENFDFEINPLPNQMKSLFSFKK
ncbi:MAG: hypothetical protein IPN72_11045 [Saprospiraceae bacterium]|nr:hypothetical protein [Saprospiraceae bacterium]